MRRLHLIIFFSMAWVYAWSIPPVKKPIPHVLTTDSSVVNVRLYHAQTLNRYRSQPEFQYKKTSFQISWWARFWKWFWSLFKFKGISSANGYLIWLILKYVFIALGAGAIIFIILKIIGLDANFIFRRRPAPVGNIEYTESLENIHEIDFDMQLEQAIARHDYRLAVRLLYLKCLKFLNDEGLIHWQISKTNNDYINELNDEHRRQDFSRLTRQFEFIWYGKFQIDRIAFERINLLFNTFKSPKHERV